MKKGRKWIRSLVITLIAIFITIQVIVGLFFGEPKSYPVVEQMVSMEQEAIAFVIREEEVYTADTAGQIIYRFGEGERQKKDLPVASIRPQGQAGPAGLVDQALDHYLIDPADLAKEIADLRRQLLYQIKQGNFALVASLKEKINLRLAQQVEMERNTPSIRMPQVITSYEAEGQKILSSPKAGLYSYFYDGYEGLFTKDNMSFIDYQSLLTQPMEAANQVTSQISKGQFVFKVVDNTTWYMVTLVPIAANSFYQKGDRILLTFDLHKLAGRVYDQFSTGDYMAIVVELDQQVTDFQTLRKLSVTLENDGQKGIVVRASSLTTLDGQVGLYKVGLDHKAQFVPVEILIDDGEELIVHPISPLSHFDYIVTDGEKVKSGDAIY